MPSEVASAHPLWSLTFCLHQARGLCANWTCSNWPSVNPVSVRLQFGLTLLWDRVPSPEVKGCWRLCLWWGHHGPCARNAPSQPGSRSPAELILQVKWLGGFHLSPPSYRLPSFLFTALYRAPHPSLPFTCQPWDEQKTLRAGAKLLGSG